MLLDLLSTISSFSRRPIDQVTRSLGKEQRRKSELEMKAEPPSKDSEGPRVLARLVSRTIGFPSLIGSTLSFVCASTLVYLVPPFDLIYSRIPPYRSS